MLMLPDVRERARAAGWLTIGAARSWSIPAAAAGTSLGKMCSREGCSVEKVCAGARSKRLDCRSMRCCTAFGMPQCWEVVGSVGNRGIIARLGKDLKSVQGLAVCRLVRSLRRLDSQRASCIIAWRRDTDQRLVGLTGKKLCVCVCQDRQSGRHQAERAGG